jgi:hypothetical protein
MPVKKLRSLEEAEDSLWQDPRDPRTWRQIDALWRFGSRFRPRLRPGVQKFHGIEEANRQRRRTRRATPAETP